MKSLRVVLTAALIAPVLSGSPLQAQVAFPGPELLGRPTNDSVTLNVIASTAIEAYVEYGLSPGIYVGATGVASAAANAPLVMVIGGLASDTRYFYRLQYRTVGTSDWTARDEHSFQTQRQPGGTFTFTLTSDSHVNIIFGNTDLYQQTLLNAAADHPDFHVDLGDTFAMDNVTTQAQARNAYLTQRPYFGLLSHSAPVFLALGNHEEEEGWHRDDTGNLATSKPILGANARKRYFLNPTPNGFYSGNSDSWPSVDDDGLPGDYYAWRWGDALFVVIDPYWYTTTKPFLGNTGGGESSDTGSGDRWDWTLGFDQYQWLRQTLESSDASLKFIFAHHGTGGTDDYIRSGANGVPFTEWGGNNEDGTTYAFDARRPGWHAPVHQLLVENHVTAFFHGHDHEFAHEERDGVVYQLAPMAADSGYGLGFNGYSESDPYTIRVLPNSGHLRVTVSGSSATVDYVRAFLPGDGPNGQVAYSYVMTGGGGPSNGGTQVSVSPSTASSGQAVTVSWSGIAVPSATDWIALYSAGAADDTFIDWTYVSCSTTPGAGAAAGSCPFVVPPGVGAGAYEIRLFTDNQFVRLATSNALTVSPVGGSATVNASPAAVASGSPITATWSGIAAPAATDWIGLYRPGDVDDAYIDWIYVSCFQTAGDAAASGSCPFLIPPATPGGMYEVRLFATATGQSIRLAASNTFTVTASGGPTLDVRPGAISAGGSVIVSWNGVSSPMSTDWIGLYVPGDGDEALIDWIWVSCSQELGAAAASGSCSFAVPPAAPPGTYEMRFFSTEATGEYRRATTSNSFTVTASP
jgi:hypothetical protein